MPSFAEDDELAGAGLHVPGLSPCAGSFRAPSVMGVPGLAGIFDSVFGKNFDSNMALTTVLHPWESGSSLMKAKGKAQAEAAFAQAQAEQAHAEAVRQQILQEQQEERAAALAAFALQDAHSQLQAAQDSLGRRYARIQPALAHLQGIYLQEPDLNPQYGEDARNARDSADDLMRQAVTTSLPSDPSAVLALAARVRSNLDAMEAAVSQVEASAHAADQALAAREQMIAEARAEAARAQAERQMAFFRSLAPQQSGLQGFDVRPWERLR